MHWQTASRDTITFASSLANKPVVLLSGQMTINDTVTIQGLGAALSTIDGQSATRLFEITSSAGAVTFDGLSLTGGKTTANNEKGGAVRSASTGKLTIRNSIVSGNSTLGVGADGGGLFASGALSVINSTVFGNTTLRTALQEANALAGVQTIKLSIPGSGVKTISPTSALPTITERLIIDATTQPSFARLPLIQLAGNLAGAASNGLTIATGASGSTIRGLAINRFAAAGIRLSGGGSNAIVGNFIGTNTAGTVALANGSSGVVVVSSANHVHGA